MEHREFPDRDNCGDMHAAKSETDVSQTMKIALPYGNYGNW